MSKYIAKMTPFILTSLLLTSCAQIQQPRLTPEAKSSIKSTRVIVNSTQTKLMLRHNNIFNSDLPDPYSPMDRGAILVHNNGTPLNHGLLGILIVEGIKSSQDSRAGKSIAPVKNKLDEINFVSNFNSSLKAELAKLSWLKIGTQDIKYNLKGNERDNLDSSKEQNVLFVGTTYALNSGFKELEVSAFVELAQKSPGNKDPRILYGNNFYFVYRLPDSLKDKESKRAYWIEDNASNIEKKLKEASSLIASMIAFDLKNTNANPYPVNDKSITFYSADSFKQKGTLIMRKNGYYIAALPNNELYAFNADDIVPSKKS